MLATFLLSKAGNCEFGFLGPVEIRTTYIIDCIGALPTSLEIFTSLGSFDNIIFL